MGSTFPHKLDDNDDYYYYYYYYHDHDNYSCLTGQQFVKLKLLYST